MSRMACDGPEFELFVKFMREHPIETVPDHVLWCTNWTHPTLKDKMLDDGWLVDSAHRGDG
jgi:2-pyrone-4,6-dicarboxylate lactonase